MKTLQFIPLLALSALTGGSAFAQINYTFQDRGASASAAFSESFDSSSASASDYQPFVATVEAFAGPATASAGHASELTPTGFFFEGFASAFSSFSGDASSSSHFSIQFEVPTATMFSLTGGSGSESIIGPVPQRIARMSERLLPGFGFSGGEFDLFWNLGDSISLDGLLEPNVTYSFTANLAAFFEGAGNATAVGRNLSVLNANGGSQAFGGGVDFSLVSPVPESGTTVAGLAVGGLALWQWRRRRA